MRNYLWRILHGLAFAFLIATGLSVEQTFVFAMTEKEGALSQAGTRQYAAVSKPFTNDVQAMESASAQLDEIDSILKATSRKIALLESDAESEIDTTITVKKAAVRDMELAEQVTQQQYDEDIRKQTIEKISAKQNISGEYTKARQIILNPGTPAMFAYEAPIAYQTQGEIIKGVISDDVLRKKIDLDFDETALGDIIQTISKIAEVNIVLDPSLKSARLGTSKSTFASWLH